MCGMQLNQCSDRSMALSTYIRKEEKCQVNNLSFCFVQEAHLIAPTHSGIAQFLFCVLLDTLPSQNYSH